MNWPIECAQVENYTTMAVVCLKLMNYAMVVYLFHIKGCLDVISICAKLIIFFSLWQYISKRIPPHGLPVCEVTMVNELLHVLRAIARFQ